MTARKTTLLIATMLWIAVVALPLAQEPVTKASMVKINATITGIDSTARTLTLRDDMGNEDTFAVGDAVQRFNELKVGQKVAITYYESIVFQLVKPGEKGSGTSIEAALARAKGALPAGTVAVQDKATVTVKAVDPSVPSITVVTADGRTVTRKIENKKNIEGVKVGDKIDITFTRALLTSVQNAK